MTTHTEGEASVTDAAPKTKTRSELIREIKESGNTFYVRNNTRARITNGSPYLSLGPAGLGDDVSILPKEILAQKGFQRLWATGKVSISDDSSIENEIEEGAEAAQLRRQREYRKLVGGAQVEEPASNRDLIEKTCLITGERVYQSQADVKNMVPPLAPAHKNRAHEFTPTVSQDEKGNEVVKFSRVTIEQ